MVWVLWVHTHFHTNACALQIWKFYFFAMSLGPILFWFISRSDFPEVNVCCSDLLPAVSIFSLFYLFIPIFFLLWSTPWAVSFVLFFLEITTCQQQVVSKLEVILRIAWWYVTDGEPEAQEGESFGEGNDLPTVTPACGARAVRLCDFPHGQEALSKLVTFHTFPQTLGR